MSSLPGYTLEAFVMWNHDLIVEGDATANPSRQIAEAIGTISRRPNITKEQFAPILALYEPYRKEVERRLCEFDEETQSWRDYAGYSFDFVPNHAMEKASELRKELQG